MESIEKPDFSQPFREIVILSSPPFCPETHSNDEKRAHQFKWERPEAPETEVLTAAFCFDYAQYMKKVVASKENDNSILRRQLFKVNEENYQLVKTLNGYKGKNWDSLNDENRILRERLDRLSRENMFLRGQHMKSVNRHIKNC